MPKSDINKRYGRFGWFFVLLCACIGLVNLYIPDQASSDIENRSLAQFPVINKDHILKGLTMKDMENWFSDQFIQRNEMIQFKYQIQKKTGIKKIENVYLTERGLIEAIEPANDTELDRNLNAMNAFYQENKLNTVFLLAPNAANIYQNLCPYDAEAIDQNKQMDLVFSSLDENIQVVDVRQMFKEHNHEKLYYKTDHHWTTLAAYYAYSLLPLEPVPLDQYDVMKVTEDFSGSLSHVVGSDDLKDSIEIYAPKKAVDYLMTNEALGVKSRTVYDDKALKTQDAYSVFLGGNYSMIKLEMDNDSSKHLLIFKDSYANSLIPFLIPHFRTITIIDPRYYYEDIRSVIKSDMITDIYYIYNSNTFVQDTSLADVIGQKEPS